MSTRGKSALILIAVLAIGMVLGAIINARIASQRMERIAFVRTQRGFVRAMENVIDIEDGETREAVRVILDSAAVRIEAHMSETRSEMQAILDSTRNQLQTVLSPEQMEQLEQHLRERRRPRPGSGERPRRGGPGGVPGGGPDMPSGGPPGQ